MPLAYGVTGLDWLRPGMGMGPLTLAISGDACCVEVFGVDVQVDRCELLASCVPHDSIATSVAAADMHLLSSG
jgi:hypothetical protein